MSSVANTPDPPYYAVIFTNEQNENIKGYSGMSGRMQALALRQPGYLGFESARDGLGITVSYWDSLEAIANWKKHAEHLVAQDRGRNEWYSKYKTRICKVERDYGFSLD
jgi:heme-degrading monooxygenase HmoA